MQAIVHHDAIRPQQREVTLLFADLRSFTELAAALEIDPLICELLAQVMDCLTEAVMHHDGLVVDYYGDGLVAMWNAPTEQPRHAELACAASLEMLETLPSVAADWLGIIQADLQLGIGVHTGMVQVGNAGSTRQSKYGPRGPNVNLASRVEAATKALGQPLIATAATVQQLSDCFTTNRICRAQLPGLRAPTDLYTVRQSSNDNGLSAEWRFYDEALRHFEQGRYADAAEIAASIEAGSTRIPWRFLIDEVQRELGRQKRRRSTDPQGVCPDGVIALNVK